MLEGMRAAQSEVVLDRAACPSLDRPLPSTPRTGQLKLCYGFSKLLRSPPSLRLPSEPRAIFPLEKHPSPQAGWPHEPTHKFVTGTYAKTWTPLYSLVAARALPHPQSPLLYSQLTCTPGCEWHRACRCSPEQ